MSWAATSFTHLLKYVIEIKYHKIYGKKKTYIIYVPDAISFSFLFLKIENRSNDAVPDENQILF